MKRNLFAAAIVVVLLSWSPETCQANGAASQVDVGRRHAGAEASYDGPAGIARTDTRVGRVNFARGLAVSYGPQGVSISHSIGVSRGGVATAHNFQLSVGPHGRHVSHGGVVSRGGDTRVISGGETYTGRGGPHGGSFSSGTGHRTNAWSRSQSDPRRSSYPWHHFSR
jgi:hypothetical protein